MRRAALLLLLLTSCGKQEAPSGEHAKIVRPIGTAYGEDFGLKLEKVESGAPVVVDEKNRAECEAKVSAALAIGYIPKEGSLQVIPLAGDLGTVKMAKDRSPADVVKAVVAPGVRVVEITWHFAGAAPVKSMSVFSAEGELLFDSLLCMPVIPFPLHGEHF